MNKAEVQAEIAKLEAEAKQILANANFINGAIQAYHKMLVALHMEEQKVVAEVEQKAASTVQTAATDLSAEVKPNVPNTAN